MIEHDRAAALRGFELLPAQRRDEVVRCRHRQAELFGETLGAGAGEEHVRCGLHDRARQPHRALHARDAGDGAAAAVLAAHDRGIELGQAVAVQHAADAGVEQRAFLEALHGQRHGIERAAAVDEQRPGFAADARQCLALRSLRSGVRRKIAGTAVQGEAEPARIGRFGSGSHDTNGARFPASSRRCEALLSYRSVASRNVGAADAAAKKT
ncbi:MAG: hypothetical protein NVS9B10_20620 [Nevskia sp.]